MTDLSDLRSARDLEATLRRARAAIAKADAGAAPVAKLDTADLAQLVAAVEARRTIPCDGGFRRNLAAGETCVGCVCWKGRQP